MTNCGRLHVHLQCFAINSDILNKTELGERIYALCALSVVKYRNDSFIFNRTYLFKKTFILLFIKLLSVIFVITIPK